MKKELNKITIFLGFIVFSIGVIISATAKVNEIGTILGSINFLSIYLATILAVVFIFTENRTLGNIGYSLMVLLGAFGLSCVLAKEIETGKMISGIGMLVMFVGMVMYFILICLKYFGFVKTNDENKVLNKNDDALKILSYYKELQAENILTDEEFEETKQKLLNDIRPKAKSMAMDDIKKWKKLLDQKIISDEEFTAIKAEMLRK